MKIAENLMEDAEPEQSPGEPVKTLVYLNSLKIGDIEGFFQPDQFELLDEPDVEMAIQKLFVGKIDAVIAEIKAKKNVALKLIDAFCEAAVGRPLFFLVHDPDLGQEGFPDQIDEIVFCHPANFRLLPRMLDQAIRQRELITTGSTFIKKAINLETQLDLLTRNASDALVVTSCDGIIERASTGFKAFASRSSILSTPLQNFIKRVNGMPLFGSGSGVSGEFSSEQARVVVLANNTRATAEITRLAQAGEMERIIVRITQDNAVRLEEATKDVSAVVGGLLKVLNLTDLRLSLKSDWAILEEKVYSYCDQIIKRELKPGCNFQRLTNGDYLIWFVDGTEKSCLATINNIRKKIDERMLGIQSAPALENDNSEISTAKPSEDKLLEKIHAAKLVSDALKSQNGTEIDRVKKAVSQFFSTLEVKAVPIDRADLAPTAMSYLKLSADSQEALNILRDVPMARALIPGNLDCSTLQRVAYLCAQDRVSRKNPVLCDIQLDTLERAKFSEKVIKILQEQGGKVGRSMILNIIPPTDQTNFERIPLAVNKIRNYVSALAISLTSSQIGRLDEANLNIPLLVLDHKCWVDRLMTANSEIKTAIKIRRANMRILVKDIPLSGLKPTRGNLKAHYVIDSSN